MEEEKQGCKGAQGRGMRGRSQHRGHEALR